MMDNGLFQDELEKDQHEDAINRLCQQHPQHQEFIRNSYLQNLKPLINEATIRTYLSILVSRKVQAMLDKH